MIINIDINKNAMDDIIKYLQKNEEIENNVKDVLYISKYLNIQKILNHCYKKIVENIHQQKYVEDNKEIINNDNYLIQILKIKYTKEYIKYDKNIMKNNEIIKKLIDCDIKIKIQYTDKNIQIIQ